MKKKFIDIKIGDITSEPILNSNYQVLITKNVKLESRHIDILKRFNINEIEVDDNQTVTADDLTAENFEKAKEYFNDKLNWNLDNAIINEIYNIAIFHKAVKLFKEGQNA